MTVMTAARGSGTSAPPAPPRPAPAPGYRSGSLGLPARPESVPQARHAALAALREWGLDELADDAALVVTELVENAIQATGRAGLDAPVRLVLLAGLRTLLVAVKDAAPPAAGRPVIGRPFTGDLGPCGDDSTDLDQHGNGLIVVAALAVRLDWKPAPGGGTIVRALLRGGHRSLTRGSPGPGTSPAPAPAPRTARPPQAGSQPPADFTEAGSGGLRCRPHGPGCRPDPAGPGVEEREGI